MIGALPPTSRRTLYWAVPTTAGVGAAALALLAGARGWKGYLRAVGAGVLGGLACVFWSSNFANLLSRMASALRKTDPNASLTPFEGYAHRFPSLNPVERDAALVRLKKEGTEAELERAVELELGAFDKLEVSPGRANQAVLGTEPEHIAVVDRAVAALSPSFALPRLLKRLARQYHRDVVEALPAAAGTLNVATKMARMDAAQQALHPQVYTELLRYEGNHFAPKPKSFPDRGHDLVDRILLAGRASENRECTRATFQQVVLDGVGELLDHGLPGLPKDQSDVRVLELQNFLAFPDATARIRRWAKRESVRQAELDVVAFIDDRKKAGDKPPIDLLHIAATRLNEVGFEIFGRRAVTQMWQDAERADPELGLDQVHAIRDALRAQLSTGELPEQKAPLFTYLDEAIADSVARDCGADLTAEHRTELGPELTALVLKRVQAKAVAG